MDKKTEVRVGVKSKGFKSSWTVDLLENGVVTKTWSYGLAKATALEVASDLAEERGCKLTVDTKPSL